MEQVNVWELLSQVETAKAGEVFRDCIRGVVRSTYCEIMMEEVAALCGGKHIQANASEFIRAGSAPGIFIIDGKTQRVKRSRVRKRAGGKNKEYKLKTYNAGKDGDEARDMILRAFLSGVSGRDQKGLYPDAAEESQTCTSFLSLPNCGQKDCCCNSIL